MKTLHSWLLPLMAAGLALFMLTPQVAAQRGYGMHHGMWNDYRGQDGEWRYCPYCGSRFDDPQDDGWAPGYHHRRSGRWGPDGYGRGPQMMRPYDDGRGDYPNERGYARDRKPLDEKEAKGAVSDMLKRSRNPNLKVGEIEEKEAFFVVDILTQNGALVDKLAVDKETGMMRSQY